MECVVGVDFDNTLVSYDRVLYDIALGQDLIHPSIEKHKQIIRDFIRGLPGGETKWRQIQGIVYGPKMEDAQLIDGVEEFFRFCKQNGVKVFIVSHKSVYAQDDNERTNLQIAALDWMEKNAFFDADGLDLHRKNIYFEPTRSEKVERIKELRCTHFIDDLEEVFADPSFPRGVDKLLYAPYSHRCSLVDVRAYKDWKEILAYFSNRIHG